MTTKPAILYIEDYPVVQQIYLEVLRSHGYKVDLAVDGKEALEKVFQNTYDLLLVDLLLPRLSGIEFLKEYRTKFPKGQAGTKVIILTDFDKPETRQEAQELGIDGYWIKVENTPYVLMEKIDQVLAGTDTEGE